MTTEQYRCGRCHATVLATDLDGFIYVYPPGVEPNASGDGRVMLSIRPGSIVCQNPQHDKPSIMRREKVE